MKFKLLLILLVFVSLNALHEDAGTTGFAFFKVRYSARAAAMAEAFTGVTGDADLAFYNPAGLINLEKRQIKTTYLNYLEDFKGGSFVYAAKYSSKTAYTVFAQYLTSSDIEKTVINSDNSWQKKGSYTAGNMLFGVAFAHKLNETIDFGITAKYLNDEIDENKASAIAADISVNHLTANKKLRLGVSVQNLGKQIKYYTNSEYDEKLPTTLNAGFAYQANKKLLLCVDGIKPFKDDFKLKFGAEYKIHPIFDLRAGYKAYASDWKLGDDDALSGFSFGFGANWKQKTLDYAIVSYGDLGYVHQVSLSYKFD